MSYLVMESRLGYAIVVDNSGRFLKVVNLGYEVGQTVDKIIYFEEENKIKEKGKWKKQFTVLAAAACFCIVLLGAYQNFMTTYGTVRMQINPDVMISVNKHDYVIDLEGLNEDGELLIENYSHFMKDIEQVSDELADRAVEQGYLKDGGQIVIQAESSHEKWVVEVEQKIVIELTTHLENKVQIQVEEEKEDVKQTEQSYTIKVQPDSDYDDNNSDYGSSSSNSTSNSSGSVDSDSDYDSSSNYDIDSSDSDYDDNED